LLTEIYVCPSKEVVGQSKDGFYLPSQRAFHEGSRNDCAQSGFKEGIAERPRLRDEDADILYEPGGKESKHIAQSGSSKGKNTAIGAGKSGAPT
jgi:hypothetical protein